MCKRGRQLFCKVVLSLDVPLCSPRGVYCHPTPKYLKLRLFPNVCWGLVAPKSMRLVGPGIVNRKSPPGRTGTPKSEIPKIPCVRFGPAPRFPRNAFQTKLSNMQTKRVCIWSLLCVSCRISKISDFFVGIDGLCFISV